MSYRHPPPSPEHPGINFLSIGTSEATNLFFAEFPTSPCVLADVGECHRNPTERDEYISTEPWILSVNASSGKCIMLSLNRFTRRAYSPSLSLNAPCLANRFKLRLLFQLSPAQRVHLAHFTLPSKSDSRIRRSLMFEAFPPSRSFTSPLGPRGPTSPSSQAVDISFVPRSAAARHDDCGVFR